MKLFTSSVFIALSMFSASAFAQGSRPASRAAKAISKDEALKLEELTKDLKDGLYTVIQTTMGDMVLQLHYDKVPTTVANFVGLATGKITWKDPKSKKSRSDPFYDGIAFHRVIDKFMIQGGCPLGTGTGGPGYQFAEEFHPDLNHGKVGVMSMARTKKRGTNGSQFFITLSPTPGLNNQYSVFGQLVKGLEVLKAIGKVKTQKPGDRPIKPVVMKRVTIHPVGAKAKAWKISTVAAKNVPDTAEDQIDRGRIWDPKAVTKARKIRVMFIIIKWKGKPGVHPLCPYNKEQARDVAQKIVRVARSKGARFFELESKYSDLPTGGQIYNLDGTREGFPEALNPVFGLKVNQVSDVLEGPKGFMIFFNPKLYNARHVLISYKGSELPGLARTKAEAKKMALEMHTKIVKKTITWDDAVKQSDDKSSKDGDLGEFYIGGILKVISDAVVKLKVGDFTELVESRYGFHIIQRIR
jgi:cyclophilin family peptidyl-prolyl cis-trans isomerase